MKLPPEQRRKALALVKESDERIRYNQWETYKPYKKQLEFHNCEARERLYSAGNQLGKHMPVVWKLPTMRPAYILIGGKANDSQRANL